MYRITRSSTGGGDALAAASAALAAAAVAVNQSRPALAAQALSHARQLHSWASSAQFYNTTYCGTVVPCRGVAVPLSSNWTSTQAAGGSGGAAGVDEVAWVAYPSRSSLDDLAWAGAWMHRATGATKLSWHNNLLLRQWDCVCWPALASMVSVFFPSALLWPAGAAAQPLWLGVAGGPPWRVGGMLMVVSLKPHMRHGCVQGCRPTWQMLKLS